MGVFKNETMKNEKINLQKYTIIKSATILEALQKIDTNQNGFLIVLDEAEKVCGVLTDGDIRRAFIRGYNVESRVCEIAVRDYQTLQETSSLSETIDRFKDASIKFLPVIDGENRLVNLITKAQIHALLLQDIHADIMYDFTQLDEGIVDHEIFRRPWGFYKTTVMNDYFQSKIISVKPKAMLSLQMHNRREEHWIVAHGTGVAQIGESLITIGCGSTLFIPKGCKHRLTNTDEKESLIITEVQIGDYFGEDDIIRFEDQYGRI